MSAFVGCLIAESLKSNVLPRGIAPFAQRVVNVPGDPDAETWHVGWYELSEADLHRLLPALARVMKPHWYGHFWRDDDLCVILAGKVFWVSVSDPSSRRELVDYGLTVGVDRKWTENIPTKLPEWARTEG